MVVIEVVLVQHALLFVLGNGCVESENIWTQSPEHIDLFIPNIRLFLSTSSFLGVFPW